MRSVGRQGFRFAGVGGAATALHVVVAMVLVETGQLSLFWANVPAFLAAFILSYLGNLKWTFGVGGFHRRRVPRFLLIALLAFALNQSIVYVVVERMDLDYRLALAVVVLAVPPIAFLLSRRFAFPDHGQGASGDRKSRPEPALRP